MRFSALFIAEYPDCSFHIKLSSFQRYSQFLHHARERFFTKLLVQACYTVERKLRCRIILPCVLMRAIRYSILNSTRDKKRALQIAVREYNLRNLRTVISNGSIPARYFANGCFPISRTRPKVDLSKSVSGARQRLSAASSLELSADRQSPLSRRLTRPPRHRISVCSC